ncbi:MAG: RNA polymerase [Thermoplasmata archaeon]|nr:MAG: RNA polymerase [Thermoplasmata archaeon]
MEEEVRYVSLSEVKNLLEKEQKKRELTYEQKLALEHAKHFAQIGVTKTKQMAKELLEIERITEPFAYKIVDILPMHPEEVRAIFAKERFTLEDKEIKKILDIVEKYR